MVLDHDGTAGHQVAGDVGAGAGVRAIEQLRGFPLHVEAEQEGGQRQRERRSAPSSRRSSMSTRHAPHTRRIGARRRRERRRGSALILLLLALALPPPQVLLLVVMLFHRDPLDREISLVCPSTALLVLQAAGVLNNDWFHRPSPSIGLCHDRFGISSNQSSCSCYSPAHLYLSHKV